MLTLSQSSHTTGTRERDRQADGQHPQPPDSERRRRAQGRLGSRPLGTYTPPENRGTYITQGNTPLAYAKKHGDVRYCFVIQFFPRSPRFARSRRRFSS